MKRLMMTLFVLVFATGMAFAQNNDATISQVGNDHEADITQAGATNEAYVTQNANGSPDEAWAMIVQSGAENLVRLQQTSFYSGSNADITQIGNRNKVHGVTESDPFLQSNGGGLVDVRMEGDDNVLSSLRGEAQKNQNNSFELDILGSDNEVGMMQEYGAAETNIEGDLNNVLVNQKSGGFDFSESTVDILGSDNYVNVYQRGALNHSSVDVNGSFNSATVTQTQ